MSASFMTEYLPNEPKAVQRFAPAGNAVDPVYLALVDKLIQLRQTQRGALVVAVASVHSGAGTSYVTSRVEAELAKHTGDVVRSFTAGTQPVANSQVQVALAGGQELDHLVQTSSYVLVDCPPMNQSGLATVIGRRCTGLLLVVEAGKTTKNEIQGAVNALTANSVPVIGLILNKRTYPIPSFIYRWL